MRTKRTVRDAKHNLVSEEYVEAKWLPTVLEQELATANLVAVTEEYVGGKRVTYTALEYECEICGVYGHTDQNCPSIDDDD